MGNFKKELDTAVSIAKEAGQIMLKYFDGEQEIEKKEDNSMVTIADKLINSLVIKRLTVEFPDDGVIGEEESNTEYGMGRKWLCDPIDGTRAYIWGTPTCMFSLALAVDGKPVVGVAYDPFLDRMYTGIIGEKSFCNNKVISVSNKDLKTGIIAVTSSVKSFFKTKYLQKFIDDKIALASFSGAVYKALLVAKGKFVGYVEGGIGAHDMAAADVILKGAGGKITSLEGKNLDYSKPFKGVIVSNSVVHEELVMYCQ
ncbi:MAG TPA: inositol monophosphatase [Candidatus Paceibacterota bacterium]